MERWVSLPAVAAAAGLSRNAVARAVHRTIADPEYAWRGVRLVVRTVHGRGGRSGGGFQILQSSLPAQIRGTLVERAATLSNRAVVKGLSKTLVLAVLRQIIRQLEEEVT